MRTLSLAVVTLVVLASPGYGQLKSEGSKDPLQLKYEQEENARKAIDKEYDETMKRTRNNASAPKRDPWGNVRSLNNDGAKR